MSSPGYSLQPTVHKEILSGTSVLYVSYGVKFSMFTLISSDACEMTSRIHGNVVTHELLFRYISVID